MTPEEGNSPKNAVRSNGSIPPEQAEPVDILKQVTNCNPDVERQSKVPDFCLSQHGVSTWFETEGAKLAIDRGLLAAPYSVPIKGMGIVLFDHLIKEGFLNKHRYTIPRTLIVSPDIFDTDPALSWDSLKQRVLAESVLALTSDVHRAVVENRAVLEFIDKFKEGLGQAQKTIVRSMSPLEGGPGKSAAGVFESLVAYDSSREQLLASIAKVALSAYSSLAIFLAKQSGMDPQMPGFMLQEYIGGLESIHAIFNTATPGEVRGICTFWDPKNVSYDPTTLTSKSFQFHIGETPIIHDMNALGKSAIEELARTFSADGKVPVEIEIASDPKLHKIALLQHRFVAPAMEEAAVSGAQRIYEAKHVAGSGTVESKHILWLRDHMGDAMTGHVMWLLVKNLEKTGEPFIVVLDQESLSSLTYNSKLGDKLAQSMLLHGAAAIELGHCDFHKSHLAAHFPRVVSDLGKIFISIDYTRTELPSTSLGQPVTIFGQKVTEYTFPHHSDLCPEDALYVGTDFRKLELMSRRTQAQINAMAMVLHLENPIIVHGCEKTQTGGVYKKG